MRTSLAFPGISLTKAEECSSGAYALVSSSSLFRYLSVRKVLSNCFIAENISMFMLVVRVSPDKSTDYGKINEDAGIAFASSYVCVARVNRVRYVLDDFKFHRCRNLMQIAELSGDNVVPREEVSARFALASSGAFRIWGVLEKKIN